MVKLPGELATLVALLDTQPGQVQIIIQYCLALLMVELGQAELIRTESGETGEQCIFETTTGDVFAVIKPLPAFLEFLSRGRKDALPKSGYADRPTCRYPRTRHHDGQSWHSA